MRATSSRTPLLVLCIFLLVLFQSPARAVPVHPDAPDGIAAATVLYSQPYTGVEDPAHLYVLLGADGKIYYQFWDLFKNAPEQWQTLEVSWPVDFAQIVDWTPSPGFAFHRQKSPLLLVGMITTTNGEVWRFEIQWKLPPWDAPSTAAVDSTRWEKLTAKQFLAR